MLSNLKMNKDIDEPSILQSSPEQNKRKQKTWKKRRYYFSNRMKTPCLNLNTALLHQERTQTLGLRPGPAGRKKFKDS